MPGTPIKRQMQAKIEAAGGAEWVLARVAEGPTHSSHSPQNWAFRDKSFPDFLTLTRTPPH
jgi:hypothetical protein